MSTWLQAVVSFSQALLTAAIAIVTTHIAIQQYKLNRRKEKLELFERRMVVYDSAMNLVSIAIGDPANINIQSLFEFQRSTKDRYFLFGSEVSKYLDEIYKRALELRSLHRRPDSSAERDLELLNWFTEQVSGARVVFMKYLDLTTE